MTEVLDALTSVLRTSQQHGSCAGRASKSELIESQALTTSLDNSSTSSLSKSKSTDSESRNFEQPDVIGNAPNNHSSLMLLASHVSRQTGQREGCSIDPGHPQSLGDGGSELGVGPSCEKAVELVQQLDVYVFGDRRLARIMSNASAAGLKIDSHGCGGLERWLTTG